VTDTGSPEASGTDACPGSPLHRRGGRQWYGWGAEELASSRSPAAPNTVQGVHVCAYLCACKCLYAGVCTHLCVHACVQVTAPQLVRKLSEWSEGCSLPAVFILDEHKVVKPQSGQLLSPQSLTTCFCARPGAQCWGCLSLKAVWGEGWDLGGQFLRSTEPREGGTPPGSGTQPVMEAGFRSHTFSPSPGGLPREGVWKEPVCPPSSSTTWSCTHMVSHAGLANPNRSH
jgi:hypothetical protein